MNRKLSCCLVAAVFLANVCLATAIQAQAPKEITNSIGMKLVLIPKGTFTMGSPPSEEGSKDDERQHEVTLTQDYCEENADKVQPLAFVSGIACEFVDLVELPSPPNPPFELESVSTPWFTPSQNMLGEFVLSPDHKHYAYWKKRGDQHVLCINGKDTERLTLAKFPVGKFDPEFLSEEKGIFHGGNQNRSRRPSRPYNLNFRYGHFKGNFERDDLYALLFPAFSSDSKRIAVIVNELPSKSINFNDRSNGIYAGARVFNNEGSQLISIPLYQVSSGETLLDRSDFAADQFAANWYWKPPMAIFCQSTASDKPTEKYSKNAFREKNSFGRGLIRDIWFRSNPEDTPLASGIYSRDGANFHVYDRNLYNFSSLEFTRPLFENFDEKVLVDDFPTAGNIAFGQYRKLKNEGTRSIPQGGRLVAGDSVTDWYSSILCA